MDGSTEVPKQGERIGFDSEKVLRPFKARVRNRVKVEAKEFGARGDRKHVRELGRRYTGSLVGNTDYRAVLMTLDCRFAITFSTGVYLGSMSPIQSRLSKAVDLPELPHLRVISSTAT
jgi:hypothetical protein